MTGFKEFSPKCNVCGFPCVYEFNPIGIDFILKDGPTGSWPSKGNRIKGQRIKASEAAAKRQKERFGHIRTEALPNVSGNECSSWDEARSVAAKELGPEKAKGFDFKVAEEKKKKLIKKV
jgi:hypothetical protein